MKNGVSMGRKLRAAAFFAAGPAAAAALGSLVSGGEKDRWYRRLNKPSFNPPGKVFGPVWSALYTLMTISAYRIWKRPPSPKRTRALQLWGAQLALNAAWSPIFFGLRRPRLALADLAGLMGALGAYTIAAARVDRTAAWMMAPYLAWVGFAGVLNEEIVRRNP